MKRIFLWATASGALSVASVALWAQAPRTPEPLSAWRYFKEVQIPGAPTAMLDFVLDRDTLDAARADQADVRLYNAAGREIPYVLRVRREIETQEPFTAREFNRSTSDGVTQVSCDLGEAPQEHNEVEIQTTGNNFRRLADVEGSSDGELWSTLVSGAILFRFSASGRTAEQQAAAYPVSRYRYLRIRVNRDPQVDRSAPELTGVQIRHSVHRKGEMVSFPGTLHPREPDRDSGRPASVWRVDLGGRIPFERVEISTSDESFSRPFRLDAVDDPASPSVIASGELLRREGSSADLTFGFSERSAERLKLTVTDDRNESLSIQAVTAQSAARQVIFEAASASPGPIRVYYGNPKAVAPHYDLSARLPVDLDPAPFRLTLQDARENPIYTPEPRPFSERSPWLIYLVLGAAAVVLAAILLSLVRRGAGFHPNAAYIVA